MSGDWIEGSSTMVMVPEPKDFEKVPAYRMKDGGVLSKGQATIEIRKRALLEHFKKPGITALPDPLMLCCFIAEHGDDVLRILQQSTKALE